MVLEQEHHCGTGMKEDVQRAPMNNILQSLLISNKCSSLLAGNSGRLLNSGWITALAMIDSHGTERDVLLHPALNPRS